MWTCFATCCGFALQLVVHQIRNKSKQVHRRTASCRWGLRINSDKPRQPFSRRTKLTLMTTVVVVVTRSDQPKPPAVAIVRQNGLSSASCTASVAVTPVSRQIWWIQVVGGRPLPRLHSCEGRPPSLVLVQIRRIWFAGTSLRSLAT